MGSPVHRIARLHSVHAAVFNPRYCPTDDQPDMAEASGMTTAPRSRQLGGWWNGLWVKGIDLLAGEEAVRQTSAWHLHRRWLWQGNGLLALTNHRLIFRPARFVVSHAHQWSLRDIECAGPGNVPRWLHFAGFWTSWYVQVSGERHWFSAFPWANRGCVKQLEGAGVSLGERRDVYK